MDSASSAQEAETRHASLFGSLLAVINARVTQGMGYQRVEIVSPEEIRLWTRYHAKHSVYEISQTVRLETRVTLI